MGAFKKLIFSFLFFSRCGSHFLIRLQKRQRFQEFEEFNKRLKLAGENEKLEESLSCASPSRMLDETAMATASIEDKENRRLHRDVLMAACVDNNLSSSAVKSSSDLLLIADRIDTSDRLNAFFSFFPEQNVSLEQSAEEILSGVKKTVEVQYLEPIKSSSPCENGKFFFYLHFKIQTKPNYVQWRTKEGAK